MQTVRPRVLTRHPDVAPPSLRTALADQIDIWLAPVPKVDEPEVLQRCQEILSPTELDACSEFHREEDRRRALIARGLLRESLSRYAPVRPEAWGFVAGAYGKPQIAAPAGLRLRFNLSHTGSLVACAVTLDHEIGIDLEDTSREIEMIELAQRVFAPEELSAFYMLAPEAQRHRFFEHWVLKEAYLKARGLGFALDPQCASFDLGEPRRVRTRFTPEAEDNPAAWWFALLDAQPGHVLALAVRKGGLPACVRTFFATPGDARARQFDPHLYAESRHAAPTRGFVGARTQMPQSATKLNSFLPLLLPDPLP